MNPNTFSKQILFSTVLIVADTDNTETKSIGTGFLVGNKISEDSEQIFLITNKHVIAKADENAKVVGKFGKAYFSFTKSENNLPKLGDILRIDVSNLTDLFLQHPNEDVDLAICNISEIYNQIKSTLNQDIFIRTIPVNIIPDKSIEFDAIEEVLFVGYPNGIYDQKNNLPIIRRGITASSCEVDFNGLKRFIVDAHVYPGSSGSPVFIKEQNFKNGNLTLGERYYLVGVISKVFHRNEKGALIQEVAPTSSSEDLLFKQMIGLGVCEKSSQILELIDLINQKK